MTPCYYCEADDDACKTCIHSDTYIDPQEEITKLREQVAAQAAVIEKLREALPDTLWFLERYSNRWDGINGKHPNCVVETAREALAIPTSSTQILDEVRRAEREKCAKVFEESGIGGDHLAAAIRAME